MIERQASGLQRKKISFAAGKRFSMVKGKDNEIMTVMFATTKKPSQWRKTTGWSSNISIFSSSLANFPRPMNTIIVLMIRVRTLREGGGGGGDRPCMIVF